MAFHKYIVTHSVDFKSEGVTTFNNAFLMPDHYGRSLESYKKLAEEARKSFPNLKDDEIECMVVAESRWCKRCPIIRFQLPSGPPPTVAGWTNGNLPDIIMG